MPGWPTPLIIDDDYSGMLPQHTGKRIAVIG